MYQNVIRPAMLYGMKTLGEDRKKGKKEGSARVTNGEIGMGYYKKGQDKERVRERGGKNCKAGRQTSVHKVALVWTREEERRLRWEKNDCDGNTRYERGRPRRRWIGLVKEMDGDGSSKGGRQS